LGLPDHVEHHPGITIGATSTDGVRGVEAELELKSIEAALSNLETAVQRFVDQQEGQTTGQMRRLVRLARHHYAVRRKRDKMFGGLSGEPGWDMLLDLFIQGAEGRKMPIKNLCLASCAPTSTAMRWIERLLQLGLIEKSVDDVDARRSLVELTERGRRDVVSLLQTP
jgi:predicted transcriptional regulator